MTKKYLFNRRKKKLMQRISHLNTLLEVIPEDHPKFAECKKEQDKKLDDLREMMTIKK